MANDLKKLLNRLSRIEGQVRGISRMIAHNCDCVDILTQFRAIRAAIGKAQHEILRQHIDELVRSAMMGPKRNIRSKTDQIILLLERAAK